jgi:hypothetical protein
MARVRPSLWWGISPAEGANAGFAVRLAYCRRKEVVRLDLDPVKAMMRDKIKLKGETAAMIGCKGDEAIAQACGAVEPEFPDGVH